MQRSSATVIALCIASCLSYAHASDVSSTPESALLVQIEAHRNDVTLADELRMAEFWNRDNVIRYADHGIQIEESEYYIVQGHLQDNGFCAFSEVLSYDEDKLATYGSGFAYISVDIGIDASSCQKVIQNGYAVSSERSSYEGSDLPSGSVNIQASNAGPVDSTLDLVNNAVKATDAKTAINTARWSDANHPVMQVTGRYIPLGYGEVRLYQYKGWCSNLSFFPTWSFDYDYTAESGWIASPAAPPPTGTAEWGCVALKDADTGQIIGWRDHFTSMKFRASFQNYAFTAMHPGCFLNNPLELANIGYLMDPVQIDYSPVSVYFDRYGARTNFFNTTISGDPVCSGFGRLVKEMTSVMGNQPARYTVTPEDQRQTAEYKLDFVGAEVDRIEIVE